MAVGAATAVKEEVVLFGEGGDLVGVITDPSDGTRDPRLPGIVLLTAGLVSRPGPNRLYVKIARVLAELGFVVLRFDFSGIGDSRTRADQLPQAESAVRDTLDAMTLLYYMRGAEQFILMGHCSGAWFSLLSATSGAPVVGAVAINPDPIIEDWTRYDRQRKMSQFYRTYYTRGAIAGAGKWMRLLTGRVDYRSIARNVLNRVIVDSLSTVAFRLRVRLSRKVGLATVAADGEMTSWVTELLRELARRDVKVVILHPEGSTGAEFLQFVSGDVLAELLRAGRLRLERIRHTDHLYTLSSNQAALLSLLRGTVRSMVPTA